MQSPSTVWLSCVKRGMRFEDHTYAVGGRGRRAKGVRGGGGEGERKEEKGGGGEEGREEVWRRGRGEERGRIEEREMSGEREGERRKKMMKSTLTLRVKVFIKCI